VASANVSDSSCICIMSFAQTPAGAMARSSASSSDSNLFMPIRNIVRMTSASRAGEIDLMSVASDGKSLADLSSGGLQMADIVEKVP